MNSITEYIWIFESTATSAALFGGQLKIGGSRSTDQKKGS